MPLAADRFETFGATHLVLLALFAAGAVVAVLVGRRQRGAAVAVRTSRTLSVVLLLVAVPGQVWQLTPADFDLGTSLPLQLSDLAWVATACALWTRAPVPTGLTYFWGLTLSIQGVLTPSLAQPFPDPRFLTFWGMHLLVVWGALYLTIGLGLGPRWREYAVTVAATVAWAVVTMGVNHVAGTDYGYLNRKPASASLLDWFGPWPVYVLVSLVVLVAGWALMTWPWTRARRPAVPVAG